MKYKVTFIKKTRVDYFIEAEDHERAEEIADNLMASGQYEDSTIETPDGYFFEDVVEVND